MKFIIKAYTKLNLGDDLFVKILCQNYPKIQFFISSEKIMSAAFYNIDNLFVVNKIKYVDRVISMLGINISLNHLLLKLHAKKISGTVHIGGSIFIQSENWKHKFAEYEREIKRNKSFFVIGSNFGPFSNNNYVLSYQNLFSEVNGITFRDKKSFDLFDINNKVLAPDIVFGLSPNSVENIYSETKYVVISVIDLTWRTEISDFLNSYEEIIINLTKQLLKKGYDVKLMSFCRAEGDESAISRLLYRINDQRVSSYLYRGNIDESLSIIKSSRGIIATRFHAMILGWVFGIPTIPFVYSDKSLNVMNELNFEGEYFDIRNIDLGSINQAIDNIENSYILNVDESRTSSQKHFDLFNNYLNLLNKKID